MEDLELDELLGIATELAGFAVITDGDAVSEISLAITTGRAVVVVPAEDELPGPAALNQDDEAAGNEATGE